MKKMITNRSILRLLHPHTIIAVSMLVSFLAWAFPDFGYFRKGLIDGYYPVSLSGVFFAVAWIVCLIVSTYVAFTVTVRVAKPWARADRRVPLAARAPYLALSIIGWAGTLYVLQSIISVLGVEGALDALRRSDANALKFALYDQYSIGLPSLRYVTILSGALALYHLTHRRFIILNLLNLLALGAVALISSRLAVVCMVMTALPLIAATQDFRIRKRALAFGAVALFLALGALNWSRNENFYRAIGIDNWMAAGFSEIIAYVGSAFQGFLAAATLRDVLVGYDYLSLPRHIKVSPELSTNSAFLQLVTEGGSLWAFSFGVLICTIAAAAAGFAYKNRTNFFFLLYGPLLYSFAELWRIYLFGQGIIKTLVIMAIAIPLIFTLFPKIQLRIRIKWPKVRLQAKSSANPQLYRIKWM